MSPLFIGVHLEEKSRGELAIGLADELWAVLFSDAQRTMLCYSVGNPDAEGEVELRFEQWEVLSKRWFLPVEKAADVIRTWFMTGQLSNSITWDCRPM
jgi:hypothetical protein